VVDGQIDRQSDISTTAITAFAEVLLTIRDLESVQSFHTQLSC